MATNEIARYTINIDGNGEKSLKDINREISKSDKLLSQLDKGTKRYTQSLGKKRTGITAMLKTDNGMGILRGANSGLGVKLSTGRNIGGLAQAGRVSNTRNTQQAAVNVNIGGIGREAEDADRKLDKPTKGIKSKLNGLSGLARTSRLGSVFRPLASGARMATLAAGGVAAAAALAAGAVVAVGVHMVGVGKEMDANAQKIAQTFQSAGSLTKELTVDATALSRTFKADFNETVATADTLARQLGVSSKEAFNILSKGFLSGANAGGDMLEQVNKFGGSFRALGLNAEQGLAVIAQGAKTGNTEELLAQLGNFKEESKTISASTMQVLEAEYGKDFTSSFTKKLKKGEVDTVSAMQTITQAIRKSKLSDKTVQASLTDMFGSEANIQILDTLAQMDISLESLASKNAGVNGSLTAQLDIEKRIAAEQAKFASTWASIGTSIGGAASTLKLGFYSAINGATEMLGSLKDGFLEIWNWDFELTERKAAEAFNKEQAIQKAQIAALEAEYKSVRLAGGDASVQEQRLLENFQNENKGLLNEMFAKSIYWKPYAAREADYLTKIRAGTESAPNAFSQMRETEATKTGKDAAKKTSERANAGINSIVGGGKEVRNVTVTIQKMVGIETVNSSVSESATDLERVALNALVAAIQGAELSIAR